ncbi:MAG TPA: MgtC/SapB family protein [Gemmatimonadaceae bacterium]|nr:MgtC/SapB family protein [Gemmatimonadaceae bacterium]
MPAPLDFTTTMLDQLDVLLRIVVAGVLTGAIGYERESAGKSAGLRTHMLVGMSAALFVGLGELAVTGFPHPGAAVGDAGLRYDPMRILQATVIGVGFLGGGIIFVDRERKRALGLTTAASIWGTAGIGMTCGLGLYVTAIGATVLFIVVLHLLGGLDRRDDL